MILQNLSFKIKEISLTIYVKIVKMVDKLFEILERDQTPGKPRSTNGPGYGGQHGNTFITTKVLSDLFQI
jgi:hypothetical protein